jgi:hypothetical protein
MPYTELLKWVTFFKWNPPEWQADQRAYMLLAAQGVKEKPERLFPNLKAVNDANYERDQDKEREGHLRSPKIKGKWLEMMAESKGGDDNFNIFEGRLDGN